MADQEMHDADVELDVDTELDAGTDEEVEVEGFVFEYSVVSPRDAAESQGKGHARVIPGGTAFGIAIKENGIK